MSYVWVRPTASPASAPNPRTDAGTSWVHHSEGVPPQYLAEVPCPLFVGCAPVDNWQWLDPVYREYRDPSYPQMGAWPPPQDSGQYATWLAQQRQWMPYSAVAYSGCVPETACADVLGLPTAENCAQWLRFDWSSASDWAFITAIAGLRVVLQVNKHGYVTNEGDCPQHGPAKITVGVYKHTDPYPALPSTWAGANFVSQSFEFNNFGVGNYVTPYGAGVATIDVTFTTAPGGGSFVVADQAKYWVVVVQETSAQGRQNGSDNNILGLRKCWAAADATLGGAPASSGGTTMHTAVVG